tara:strand:- start:421 stop:1371 length:951 start_codon:yes stop_codon:yes gene_type:complete
MKSFSRKMVSENSLCSNDLIWPVFLSNGNKSRDEISSMPGVYRYSIDVLLKELDLLVEQGLNAIALFPTIKSELKDERGSYAFEPKNFIFKAVRKIKKEYPKLGIICDVALDPYTNHGHDGIIINGKIDNDKTLENLINQSLNLAEAGCDIVAPSDMMDGRVGVIRSSFENNGFNDVMIMSYAAKYSSSLYGPFRDAVNAGKLTEPRNKKSYQMDYTNSNEAMHEISMDITEGADMIMIKPGLPYLDIITKSKQLFSMPTFAYQVSGEYSMIMSASKLNYINKEDAILELMLCFKRAGADGICTYFAPFLLSCLRN